MNQESLFVGGLLLVLGILNLINPVLLLRLRIWFAKTLYGAEFKPSDKTIKIQRILGVVYIVLGILAIAQNI